MSEKLNEGQSVEVETHENETKQEVSSVEVETPKVKSYSEEEVVKLLQSERDKLITKKTKEIKQEQEKAKTLEEQVADLQHYRYENEKKIILEQAGASTKLSKFIQGNTPEEMQTSLKELMEIVDSNVSSEVENRLKTNVRQNIKTNTPSAPGITSKEFRKMSYTERAELKSNDPDLYQSLINN